MEKVGAKRFEFFASPVPKLKLIQVIRLQIRVHMQSPLPKLATVALVVIAVSLILIAYKLFQSSSEPEEKVIYIDAASGKVYEQQSKPQQPLETTEEKLRKEYPEGKRY